MSIYGGGGDAVDEAGAGFSRVRLEGPLAGAAVFYCCHLVFPYAVSAHGLESTAEQEFSHFDLFNSYP